MDIQFILKELIAKYIGDREGRSVRSLALRSDIPQTTLWSLSKGTTKPNFAQAISVLTCVTTPEEAAKILEEHFPDEAKKAAKIYSLSRARISSEVYKDFLASPIANHIFLLASTRVGVAEDCARELYGRAGVECLHGMESAELLKKDSFGTYRCLESEVSQSPSDTLKCFRATLSLIKNEQFGTPNALLGFLTESVNEKTQLRVKAIFSKALRDAYDEISDPANNGDKSIFIGCAMGLLDDHTDPKENN